MQHTQRRPIIDVAGIDRIEMAKEILDTAKEMQLQGLKALLKSEIQSPLIPAQAKAHAELAFKLASDIESDAEWRERELEIWVRKKKYTIVRNPLKVFAPDGRPVPVPPYMLRQPLNLRRLLDQEIAAIGMIAAETVYNDIIAEKDKKAQPGPKPPLLEEEPHEPHQD